MNTATPEPATTPILVQRSDLECTACSGPHLSRPQRGPTCTLGDQRVLHRILGVLDTGRPWPCRPLPTDPHGTPALPDPPVDQGVATWADEGSRGQAVIARVAHRSTAKPRDGSVRQGDGTHTVAQQGARALATRGPNPTRGSQ